MKLRRLIAAAISAVALLAVNVGMADSASAQGSAWGVNDTDQRVQTFGSAWG
jgi:hypothetical protein